MKRLHAAEITIVGRTNPKSWAQIKMRASRRNALNCDLYVLGCLDEVLQVACEASNHRSEFSCLLANLKRECRRR